MTINKKTQWPVQNFEFHFLSAVSSESSGVRYMWDEILSDFRKK